MNYSRSNRRVPDGSRKECEKRKREQELLPKRSELLKILGRNAR
jgi:hypothetical protein